MQCQERSPSFLSLDRLENLTNDPGLDGIFDAIFDSYETTIELPDNDLDINTFHSTSMCSSDPLRRSRTGGSNNIAPVRVRTYTARKQETEELLKELPQLESYLDFLKHKAAETNDQINPTQKKRIVNSCLRDRAHRQHYQLARVQSAMTAYLSRQNRAIPFDAFIHLGIEHSQRMTTLTALKPQILADTQRYVMERSAYMDLSVACKDYASFVTPEEDYYALSFAVMPLKGVNNPRAVFDALMYQLSTMEMLISVSTGDLTIREHSECDQQSDEQITQHRLLRSVPGDVQVESNQVVFSTFGPEDSEASSQRDYGLIVMVATDKDDLYPYSPMERLRQATTKVFVVKKYNQTATNGRKREDERTEVVVIHANFMKLHRSDLNLSRCEMMDLRDRLAATSDLLCDTVKAAVTPTIKKKFARDQKNCCEGNM